MTRPSGTYPDNAAIFARKAKGRKERAGLSFAEKLAVLDRLRDRVEPIIEARERKRQIQTPRTGRR